MKISKIFHITHCLKITQNVSFEFFDIGTFHQFWSCLVLLRSQCSFSNETFSVIFKHRVFYSFDDQCLQLQWWSMWLNKLRHRGTHSLRPLSYWASALVAQNMVSKTMHSAWEISIAEKSVLLRTYFWWERLLKTQFYWAQKTQFTMPRLHFEETKEFH